MASTRARKERVASYIGAGVIGGGNNPQPTPGALELSGILANGIASTGIIKNAASGSTLSSNVAGLTINSAARTYSFDGSAPAGDVANGLVETVGGVPTNTPCKVLPAATGTLKPSGRLFFANQLAIFMILAGYASTSVLTVTSDDGTALTVTTNSQGYPIVTGTFTTPGVKILTITEALQGGGSNVSTWPVVVRATPAAPTLAKAKQTAAKIAASVAARVPLAVGPTPPVISFNSGNSLVNGRTQAQGGQVATTAVPDGQRGVALQTALAQGYIYADTTVGSKAFATGTSKRFIFNGTRFDFRASSSSGNGGFQIMVLYTEDADAANPTWYKATAVPSSIKNGTFYVDVNFPGPPARVNSRAVEIVFGELTAGFGFNFDYGSSAPPALAVDKPRIAAWNDSYEFGGTGSDLTIGSSSGIAAELLGTPNVVLLGHRTNAWTRLGGTTGVHAYVADRFGSNPWGLAEVTRFGHLDIAFDHMSINDNVSAGFSALPSGGNAPKFNNAGGSNSFVAGTIAHPAWLKLAFQRQRLAQPEMLIVVDMGWGGPDAQPSASTQQGIRDAFSAVFDSDPAAILVNWIDGSYRWMGQSFPIPGFTAPLVPSGAIGSSPYFNSNVDAVVTGSVTGDVLTVTAVTSGVVQKNAAISALGSVRIRDFGTGTGGVGTYLLQYAPGDQASGTVTLAADKDHPTDAGVQKVGELRAGAVQFLAGKIAAA
jgi:hypothetical protein